MGVRQRMCVCRFTEVSSLLLRQDSRDEWVHFVSISVALHLFSSFYQLVFWSSEVQPFARDARAEPAESEGPPSYNLVVKEG